jgi:hypothetical protein
MFKVAPDRLFVYAEPLGHLLPGNAQEDEALDLEQAPGAFYVLKFVGAWHRL